MTPALRGAFAVAAVSLVLSACSAPAEAPEPTFLGSVGASEWEAYDGELPPGGGGPDGEWETPQAALEDFVAWISASGLPGHVTGVAGQLSGRPTEDEATALVRLPWTGDDSLAGEELRIVMSRGPGGWSIDRVERRVHCRRGVTDGVCL